MKIAYDDALPITARHDDIAAAIRDHQVVVVAGETGSGKTTQLPKIAYELGREASRTPSPGGSPRARWPSASPTSARSSSAPRSATPCGSTTTSADTAIRLVTDGLLLAEVHGDRRLERYDTIIIDEAHERSLSIDFLLGYLKQLLPRRPDLKVVITSATIDVERFAEMFDAPVIEVSGRTYPVEVRYRPLAESDAGDMLEGIADAIAELPRDGDILVFLSGEREIRDAAEFLAGKKYPRTEILPLYGRLAAGDQQKIFSDHAGRRIVLATNVAETSLTVPGIRFVIDPGIRPHLALQPAAQGPAPADRADLAGQRRPAGRSMRSRRRRHLHPPLLRGGLRGPPGVHRPGDPAHQPGVGAAADGVARPGCHQGLPVPRSTGLPRGHRRPQPAVRAGRAAPASG